MSHIILVIYLNIWFNAYRTTDLLANSLFNWRKVREPFKLNPVWEDEQPEERTFWERTKQDCPVMKHVL